MKKNQIKISDSEMLNALMENIPDAIYFKDLKNRFISVNKSLTGRLDIKNTEDAYGKTDFDFFTSEHAKKAFADEDKIIKTGNPLISIEEKETYAGKEDKWVSTTKMPLRDNKGKIIGTFGISRDITNIKKTEEKIKHLNNILLAIRNINQLIVREKNKRKLIKKACENLTENRGYFNAWIILKEKSHIIEYAESKTGKNFNLLLKEIKNKNGVFCWGKAISGPGVVLVKNPASNCTGCPLSGSYGGRGAIAARLMQGKNIYGVLCASIKSAYVNNKQEMEFFKEVADDISFALYNLELEKNRRETTEKLKIAKRESEKSAKKAIESDSAKSQFLANMSHEIRTPMNAILGFSEILSEQLKDPKHTKFTDTIISSGKTLLNLINDILDLSKIEAGKIDFQYRPVNPNALFNDIARIFTVKIKEKGIRLLTDIDEKLPPALLLDEVRMRQILFNLVGNAVKFTDQGYVELKVKGIFHPDRSKVDLIFSVKDTGIGISEDDKAIIFDAFKQSSGQSSKKYGGTGLGLAITKRLVEMMNGDIAVDSVIGKGSVFIIKMKEVSVSSLDSDIEEKNYLSEDIVFKNQKVLVVDDIESNRLLLNEILTLYKLRVIEAVNGREAINMAKNKNPDVILMDLRMPVMDGYEAIKILKNDSKLKNIPVIVLTASVMKSTEDDIKKIKCDGYIRKPVRRHELISELKKYLDFKNIQRNSKTTATTTYAAGKNESSIKKSFIPQNTEISLKNRDMKIPELISLLENEISTRHSKLKKEFIINDIEDFAEEIKKLGEKYRLSILSDWGKKISEQAGNFDLESLQGTFNDFRSILDRTKGLKL